MNTTAPAREVDCFGFADRQDGTRFDVWRHYRTGAIYWTELDEQNEHYGPDNGPFETPRDAYDDGRVQGYRRED